jgi:choline transport protein
MCEDLKDASKQAPRVIIMSVYIGAVTGFVFLIAVCFFIEDIDQVANTPTLVSLIQIFFDSTNSNVGSCSLTTLIAIIDLGCANALLAEGTRPLYAFARDRGLLLSSLISKVEPRHQISVNAILLGTVVQMAFNSIYFGTITGFNTFIAIAAEGFYLSYAMPLLVHPISYFSGTHTQLSGPWAMKPLVSVTVDFMGLTYLVFACITFNFPFVYPVTSENINYTSAAIGIIMFIVLVTWLTTARKHFSGPEAEGVRDLVEGRGSDSEGGRASEKLSKGKI